MELNSNQNSKNRVFMSINTTKESAYYADSKYIRSIKLIIPIKRYDQEKIYLFLKKKKKLPPKSQGILMKITPQNSAYENPIVEVSSFYLEKSGILYVLLRNHRCLFIFFSRYDGIEPMAIEDQQRAILVTKTIGGKVAFLQPYSFKLSDQNFDTAILFNIVERSNN